MGKTCTRCAVDKPLDDFPLKNSKAPNGPRIAMCKPCRNAYSLEKKKAKNPDMKTRNLRTNLVTEETQKCDACELVKNVTLFPEQTCKNGLPQKTCQDCQNATKAKRRDAISEGKREVGQGMAYHHPIVDGKKQCRDCEEWKVLETEFPTRKDSIDGYFHECKDCRRDNARDYGHEKWNAVLQDRQERRAVSGAKVTTARPCVYDIVIRQRGSVHFEFDCRDQRAQGSEVYRVARAQVRGRHHLGHLRRRQSVDHRPRHPARHLFDLKVPRSASWRSTGSISSLVVTTSASTSRSGSTRSRRLALRAYATCSTGKMRQRFQSCRRCWPGCRTRSMSALSESRSS